MSATIDPIPEKDASSEEGQSPNVRPEPVATHEDADSSCSDQSRTEVPLPIETIAEDGTAPFLAPEAAALLPLFENYEYVPPPPPPRRKPDFADCVLFVLIGIGAFFCSGLLMLAALHFHLFGVSNLNQANGEIHYRIGSQVVWYVLTLAFSALVFPLAWRRSFFQGIQWRAGAAGVRIWRLIGAAVACFGAAILDELLMPGPDNAPIDETFRMPGAVWPLFAFGVTLAPLIEEIAFRGLLLPSLCTAWDWIREQVTHTPPPALAEDGFPRWSVAAMVFASVVVSAPFALMHAPQTAYSIGPFLLLVCVSLVLCWVRLGIRSLAASVMVHATYNLLLFSMMALGTGGFRHLDKM